MLKKKKKNKKRRRKNAMTLVFQYKEDAIQPELCSPSRFRIQGWSPERDGVVGVAVWYFPFLI